MAGERSCVPLLAGAVLLLAPNTAAPQQLRLFETADRCIACHTGVVAPSGEDVSIGPAWRASMMANSARDPYWQAAVRREVMDRPAAGGVVEAECSTCHMPLAHVAARAAGRSPTVFEHLGEIAGSDPLAGLAADGVSCALCHQIQPDGLGSAETFNGHFTIDGVTPFEQRRVFGPFEVDTGRATIMRSASGFTPERASHIQQSELCASCHTLITRALDPNGNVIGRLPEQVPYLEWRHSDYVAESSCQTCHMPVVTDSVPVSGVLGLPRAEVSRHSFRGGNTFMLRMLNRYRDELGVEATTGELDAAIARTEAHLADASAGLRIEQAEITGDRLLLHLVVNNRAGHKLPTAYPSRRAWLHVVVRAADGRTLFESGALHPDGRIEQNDNDADARRFEPHYTRIDRADQVQIYEAILGTPEGEVTTGLLAATQYLKDNRLLPRGFDKLTAGPDIAVFGGAGHDADFGAGGDRVEYAVAVGPGDRPLSISAELLFQPIGFRWARNLEAYRAPETDRFVAWYDAMSRVSASTLARDSVRLR